MPSLPPLQTSWLAYCTPKPNARLRLFCFPFAGGGASAYRDWAKDFPLDIEICPVQYPGRETRIREKLITNMDQLADAALAGLAPYLDRPYFFLGHSMGALVAYELATRLSKPGAAGPARLFASGYRAPQLPYRSSLRHDLPKDEFISVLRNLEGTPKEAIDSPELMEFMLPIIRADCQICDLYTYQTRPPLNCPITVYGGAEDVDTEPEALLAWKELTQSSFDMKVFPGGHFFLQTARQEFLGALIADILRQPVQN